ncbi:hypothetical protein LLS47_12225 [Rouxiella badensis]|uniref:hypothetical protein n=1 Tax=Rouxiella badensis TaxID=1646377 RepID=UPI001D15B026|nr:hypothetical protein [Rouxiella badensis]MCC3733694.1 hypothetical protein [Rouxiella badensis]MCC3759653.1 hypothetical protein [Rouxiella badensis]
MSDEINDERLKRVREILEWFRGDYDPVDDQENFEAMRDAMGAIDELLAHRRRAAEVNPIKLPKKADASNLPFAARVYNAAIDDCAKAIKDAGGTVEGDNG